MKLQAAFIFLVGDADETTRAVVSTPSIELHAIGCRNYDEAVSVAKACGVDGVTAVELCAGFGNEGIARIQQAVGPDVEVPNDTLDTLIRPDVAVGAVKFDFHPALGFRSGDRLF